MKLKTLLTIFLITTSMSVSAGWTKSDMDMYDVMQLPNAHILSTVSQSKYWTSTTISAHDQLFNCLTVFFVATFGKPPVADRGCFLLTPRIK